MSQFNSPGGGARFLRGLCLGLLKQAEVTEVGLFIDADAASRDGLLSLLPSSRRLTIHLMDSRGELMGAGSAARNALQRLRAWARRQPTIVRAYRLLRYRALQGTAIAALPRITLSDRVVAGMSDYDVAYFPWPRQVIPPDKPHVLVATFHDFNHRHRFGNYRPQDIEVLDAEMVEWLSGRVQPITSTHFIANELNTYYPMRTHEPQVVYLSTFAIHDPGPEEVASVIERFGLRERYVLCPTNIGPHKNVISLFRAAGQMKRDGVGIGLVLTGSGTQCLGLDPSKDPLYASIFKEAIDELNSVIADENLVIGVDIWPLGYVTDFQMDALVRGATLVAAPSRYEAGSGPALDAWWLGTPVASSALPPVLEQIEFLGTEAALFEPTDVEQMTAVLRDALAAPERMRAMAARSQQAMSRYTWDDVAAGYVRVFRRALAQSAPPQEETGGSTLEDYVVTRLLDHTILEERALQRFCQALPGNADQELRLRRTLRLRAAVGSVPLFGPAVRTLYRRIWGRHR